MGALVLNPHDVLKNPLTSRQALISPPASRQALISPPASRQALISPPASRPRFPRNQNPSRSNRTQQPNRRKRSPNSSPPSRATVSPPPHRPTKSLTVGDVKILKRGEQLAKTSPPKEEAPSKPVESDRNGPDLDLGSTERLCPDPKSVTIQIRVAEPKKVNGFYAGSAFFTSPPPSSLPLPAFFMTKKNDVVAASDTDVVASSEICKLLGLKLQ